jgi:PAS domain S-box-containing protein
MAEFHPARAGRGPDDERAALADAAPDAVFTIDREGTVVAANQAVERVFGYTNAESVGESLADLVIPPELRARHWSGLMRLAAGGEPRILDRRVRLRAMRKGGETFPVELTVVRTSEDPVLFTGFVQDLSDCTPLDDEAGEARDRRLAEASERLVHLGAWEMDLETRDLHWSDGMYEIWGVDRDTFTPRLDSGGWRLLPGDRAAAERLMDSIDATPEAFLGQDIDTVLRVVRPDESVRDVSIRGRLSPTAAGRPRRWHGTAQDITEQRSVERALRAHDALARALRDTVSFDEGLVALVQRLADALELPLGVMWTWDDDRSVLICRAFNAAEGVDAADVEAIARRTSRRPGEGLAGRAWQREEAIVADDLAEELGEARGPAGEAAVLGLRSGVAFPAMAPDGPLAVLTFYGTRPAVSAERLATSLASIGYELGDYLARHRALLGPQQLSPREIEVLQCAAEGNIGREIADLLVVSPATVKTHFENIYEKLGVGDRAAAVAHGLRLGLIH